MGNTMRMGQLAVALSAIAGCADMDTTAASGAHCVSSLSSHDTACFDTFTDAVSFATAGAITDAPASPTRAFQEDGFKATRTRTGRAGPGCGSATPRATATRPHRTTRS